MRAKIDGFAVYADGGLAHGDKVQARCRDDDIGFDMLARFQLDARFGEMVDMVGDNLRLALGNRREHVAIGNEAQALFPWAVFRDKMGIDIDRCRQSLPRHIDQLLPQLCRIASRIPISETLHIDIAPPGQRIGQPLWHDLAHKLRKRVNGRPRYHIGWRTLQHGNLRALLRHHRDNRHRRRA